MSLAPHADPRNRARLILLCGRSFSGKSTVARALRSELAAQLVSLDDINALRGLHGGDGIAVEEWIHTHEIASVQVATALAGGETVVVDDTSSPRFLRDGWRSLATEAGASFALVFVDADRETILRRQTANRAKSSRHDVRDDVLEQHLADFEPPEEDEPAVTVRSDEDVPDIAARDRARLLDALIEPKGAD